MESPGTGDALIHGPPNASQVGSTSPSVESSTKPESASEPSRSSLSRSSSLLQQKRSSLPPRARSGTRHAKRLTLNFPINIPLNQPQAPTTPDLATVSPGSMTPITQSSSRPSPALPEGLPMPFDVQDDGYDFLRAIASQERKVMELREELQRAEADLSALKKQWTQSEKTKKRTEINHHAEPMLPLRSPDLTGSDSLSLHRRDQSMSSVGSSTVSQERLSRELDRRASLRATATAGTTISSNGRRVFQGSHTRTLSLLSPVTMPGSSAIPPSGEVDRASRTPRSATLPSVERSNPTASTTTPSLTSPIDESQVPEHLLSQWRKSMPPPSREVLMRTGKQMASDLREGLWTFFEDIRQATVGEEGINATESRTMSSPNSLAPPNSRKRDSLAKSRSRERLSVTEGNSRSSSSSSRGRGRVAESSTGKDTEPDDVASSFWHEFGVDSPAQKSPGARRSPTDSKIDATTPKGTNETEHPDHRSGTPVNMEDDAEDNWDAWDSPPKTKHTPSSSRSTVESTKPDQSPGTRGSSPRTSASFGDWDPIATAPDPIVTEGIPWPAITKLAPNKLQRTASNLMAEWERSLSPSPERKPLSSSRSKTNKKD